MKKIALAATLLGTSAAIALGLPAEAAEAAIRYRVRW